MHSHSNSVKKHRYFVDYLTKRKQTRRDAHSAASPEENRIESQGSGFDPEKVEGPDGYAVFAALTQTAETEIKPDRNPVKRIRSGKEEQRNEREMTFGANQKNRIVSQRSGYDPEKEEGPDVYVVFAALTQTAETE